MTKTFQLLICGMIAAVALGANHYALDMQVVSLRAASPNGARVPVLVELFTSEGCSDCPPADKMLMELEAKQPVDGAEIMVLSEHVDYWNHDGWKDRFSSKEITERQQNYSWAFHLDSSFTPQMVVDGRSQFVGSNGRLALKSIAEAAQQSHAYVAISRSGNNGMEKNSPAMVNVDITNVPALGAKEQMDVYIAVTESGLNSSVKAGENKGREIAHTGVMRKLTLAGKMDGKSDKSFKDVSIPLIEEWNPVNLKIVAFVQGHSSKKIYGATSVKL